MIESKKIGNRNIEARKYIFQKLLFTKIKEIIIGEITKVIFEIVRYRPLISPVFSSDSSVFSRKMSRERSIIVVTIVCKRKQVNIIALLSTKARPNPDKNSVVSKTRKNFRLPNVLIICGERKVSISASREATA